MTKKAMLGALVLTALAWSTTASAQTVTIAGSGSGGQENPPIVSAGVMWVSCTMNAATIQIACTARVHNIVDLTAGHIHVGAKGTNGPTVMNVPNLPLRVSDDFVLNWVWTAADFTARAAQGLNNLTDFFQACSSGNCYVNFHTTSNPGGEIRAQLCPQGDGGRQPGRQDNPFFQINVCEPNR